MLGHPTPPPELALEATGTEPIREPGPAGATFRRLMLCGLTATEAGNLTARLTGLGPVRGAWSLHEIEHLLFLRSLVEGGRIAS